MPVFAQERLPIPTKDIVSWCYEHRSSYDQDKPIFVDTVTDESISANQTYDLIRKLVAGLRAVGIQKGDCVCLHAFNNLYYPIIVLGIVAAGGVWVGTNPSYTPYELQHALTVSRAKLIIAEEDLLSAPKEAAKKVNLPDSRILLFGNAGKDNHRSWTSLLEHGSQDWVRFDDLETAKNTTAFLLFSSGTTGLPKAAQLSHYNLIAEHTLVHENPAHPPPYKSCMIGALPFFHASQAPYTHTSSLRAGFTTHVMRRFDLWGYLENVKKYSITQVTFVPPMVAGVVNAALSQHDRVTSCLRSVRSVVCAAAPLDKDMQAKLQRLLPPTGTVNQFWAMSETSCVASNFYYPEKDDTGSVGRFMPNLDVKVVDDDGKEIGPYDVRGELCIRGPTVVRGYLNNPEANKRDWDEDGFFHTGDTVVCDGKTKLWYIVDRKKELLKVRGFQVAPAELEGVLFANPKILDVAVIGVPAENAGEVPRAYVVKRAGADLSEMEVKSWLDGRLSRHKRLDGGVKFVDSIPKTASGKILKRVLREEAKKEVSSKL